MSDAKEPLALADLFGTRVTNLTDHTPHCQRLGMQVLRMAPHVGMLKLPYREELIGDPVRGVVFGGAITTLLDHAGGIAVFCSLSELTVIATLDLRIDYLRAAEPGRDLIGEAHCYRVTTDVAFVRATAWERSPDDPFASCLATYMLTGAPGEGPFARAVRARRAEQP